MLGRIYIYILLVPLLLEAIARVPPSGRKLLKGKPCMALKFFVSEHTAARNAQGTAELRGPRLGYEFSTALVVSREEGTITPIELLCRILYGLIPINPRYSLVLY